MHLTSAFPSEASEKILDGPGYTIACISHTFVCTFLTGSTAGHTPSAKTQDSRAEKAASTWLYAVVPFAAPTSLCFFSLPATHLPPASQQKKRGGGESFYAQADKNLAMIT